MFLHYFQIISIILFVCQSFIWLISVLILVQYRYISWKSYLSEYFWRHSWDTFSLHLCPLGKFGMEHPWTPALKNTALHKKSIAPLRSLLHKVTRAKPQ